MSHFQPALLAVLSLCWVACNSSPTATGSASASSSASASAPPSPSASASASPTDPTAAYIERLEQTPGCRFEPARVVTLDLGNKKATEGATRRPNTDGIALLETRIAEQTNAKLPTDYVQWLGRYDGFNIGCPGATQMQIHNVASAVELYEGGSILDAPFVEIGTDNGGMLFAIDLKNKWGRGPGAIWMVAMNEPDAPFYAAATLGETIGLVVEGTDIHERSMELTPGGGKRQTPKWGIQQ